MACQQPQVRRAYKRFAPQVWDEYKNVIRELFLEEDKTHQDVAVILKERYDFAIGVRQLKRKTDEWGFTKYIPSREMAKMIRVRRRRQEQLNRSTQFMRRAGTGEFQKVPDTRLDAYQKRFSSCAKSMSQCSGMPSNIIYHTPSNGNPNPSMASPATVRSSNEMALEFNNSVERTFGSIRNDGLSPSLFSQQSRERSGPNGPQNLTLISDSARENFFAGDYSAAAQKFKLLAQRGAPGYWVTIMNEFKAELALAACPSGCPQSMISRTADILSRFLIRERENYIKASPGVGTWTELCKTLTALKLVARFYGSFLAQQRALQIWEPILGPAHPKIEILQANISSMRNQKPLPLDSLPNLIQAVDSPEGSLSMVEIPQLRTVQTLLHLEDGPADHLLEKLHAIESSDTSSHNFKRELSLLRYGRSRALLGVYYSVVGRFGDAEATFLDSNRYMEYEACMEIKLHRMLWYAEHKTRTMDWIGVSKLICQAHEVFMENDTPSKFIIEHFPDRFRLLCLAVSRKIPIDKVANETVVTSSPECIHVGSHPMSPLSTPRIPHSSLTSSVLSPQRLFPPTPRGIHSAIDVDAWRQFVHYASADGPANPVTPVD